MTFRKPSVKMLIGRGWTAEQSKEIHKVLREYDDKPRYALMKVSDLLGAFGVEYIQRHGYSVACYVNRGEPYAETLLADYRTNSFIAISWGAWVESEERYGRRVD